MEADLPSTAAPEMTTRRPLALGTARSAPAPTATASSSRRVDLGTLVESESDWHRHAGQHTMPMPRITADMTAPPAAKIPARAWVETLFD